MIREIVINDFEGWCSAMGDLCPVICCHALIILKEQETEISKISKEYLELVGKVSKQPKIVRCKDCRYYNSEPDSQGDHCDKIHWSRGHNWFCADGIPKTIK